MAEKDIIAAIDTLRTDHAKRLEEVNSNVASIRSDVSKAIEKTAELCGWRDAHEKLHDRLGRRSDSESPRKIASIDFSKVSKIAYYIILAVAVAFSVLSSSNAADPEDIQKATKAAAAAVVQAAVVEVRDAVATEQRAAQAATAYTPERCETVVEP